MSALQDLPSITPKAIENLAKLNIFTIFDLLFHLPLRYNDRTVITKIADIACNNELQVIGQVYNAKVVFGRRRMMTATLQDDTGEISLRFFHFSSSQLKGLADGKRVLCFGEPRRSGNRIEMIHPQYRVLQEHEPVTLSDRLEPVYPTTKGLQQKRLQSLVDKSLKWAEKQKTVFEDVLQDMPAMFGDSIPMLEMLNEVHKPRADTDKQLLFDRQHPAQKRLVFDELLAHHLSIMKIRVRSNLRKSYQLKSNDSLVKPFMQNLPFELTKAQAKVLKEIKKDMGAEHPMMRLVQGDVGSGKTVVALVACLYAVENQYQAAIMAPTELLAEQHFRYFTNQLLPLGIQVAWLASGLSAKKKREMLELIETGTAAVVVGTHALFQDGVNFKNLAVSITDEQHRFGVQQRLQLTQKGSEDTVHPHQLTMTATPIPRTLAMSMYAHLDYSVIDELPPGRKPITTVAIADSRRDDIIERIREICQQGAQVYWVCSLIEESDALQSQAATDTHEYLQSQLAELNIGLLHGRLKSAEKDAVMQDFINKKINVLVATTVIEVGVDVPNASLMIIENAERFGLAQLHQLRGRVGRGEKQSSCVLLYKAPLGDLAKKRIEALRETTDGFELARVDLEIRGPGEVLGTKQSGDMQMRIANLGKDLALLPDVQKAAHWLLENHPERVEVVLSRWLGNAVEYANA
ncbi:MAG: ATP-dependent DNA helicase RecG [Gammaproteobacteria bacterium]